MKAVYQRYILNFKQPGGTSRGVLHQKETWFIKIIKEDTYGIGECSLFRGLSCDDVEGYETKLAWVCDNISLGLNHLLDEVSDFPSIQFGLEMAFRSLQSNYPFILFPSKFTGSVDAIPINGLVWMGSPDFMKSQIKDKIDQGFTCIKLKIGALDFHEELDILRTIRREYTSQDIEIRVDANGAFQPEKALERLKKLSEFRLHSIEQPIKQGMWQDMASLCEKTPLPIALDEELIGILDPIEKQKLMQTIDPQYIILKPSLIGGYSVSMEWIDIAEKQQTGWWITSALESNIGLNAIAQWTYALENGMPQGLGTGSLFTNNFDSPLTVKNGTLQYLNNKDWNVNLKFS